MFVYVAKANTPICERCKEERPIYKVELADNSKPMNIVNSGSMCKPCHVDVLLNTIELVREYQSKK